MNIEKRRATPLVALSLMLASSPSPADDLTGSSNILCTAVQATGCDADGECTTGPPWNWNIPQFVVVDLEQGELRTTKASEENRNTPIKNMERDDGQIFLQGVEGQRAFSLVIDEGSGTASFAVAMDGLAVVAFGACTPLGQG